MIKRKQTLLALGLMIMAGLSVSGCANTMHGAGSDIENAGEAVQDASD